MGTNQGREGRRAGPAAEVIDVADLLRLLIESVKDYAIFALDPHGRVLTWNSGAERMKPLSRR
jgi:PAS domain-containing protein